jgi:hypothetical protein
VYAVLTQKLVPIWPKENSRFRIMHCREKRLSGVGSRELDSGGMAGIKYNRTEIVGWITAYAKRCLTRPFSRLVVGCPRARKVKISTLMKPSGLLFRVAVLPYPGPPVFSPVIMF